MDSAVGLKQDFSPLLNQTARSGAHCYSAWWWIRTCKSGSTKTTKLKHTWAWFVRLWAKLLVFCFLFYCKSRFIPVCHPSSLWSKNHLISKWTATGNRPKHTVCVPSTWSVYSKPDDSEAGIQEMMITSMWAVHFALHRLNLSQCCCCWSHLHRCSGLILVSATFQTLRSDGMGLVGMNSRKSAVILWHQQHYIYIYFLSHFVDLFEWV